MKSDEPLLLLLSRPVPPAEGGAPRRVRRAEAPAPLRSAGVLLRSERMSLCIHNAHVSKDFHCYCNLKRSTLPVTM